MNILEIIKLKDLRRDALWKWYLGIKTFIQTYNYGNKERHFHEVVYRDWIKYNETTNAS